MPAFPDFLPDDYRAPVSETDKNNPQKLRHGIRDIERGEGVCVRPRENDVLHRDAEGPEDFVYHDRKRDREESRGESPIETEKLAEGTGERVFPRIARDHENEHFHETGDDGRDGRTGDAEGGKRPDAENEEPVEENVRSERDHRRRHGKLDAFDASHDEREDEAYRERKEAGGHRLEEYGARLDDGPVIRVEADDEAGRAHADDGEYRRDG